MREYGRVHVNKKIDIVAIKIDQLLVGRYTVQKEYHNFGFFDNTTTTNELPTTGDSICISGYPERDLDRNKTSLRTRSANVIVCPPAHKTNPLQWSSKPPSIDDCFCFNRLVKYGMSGSPVVSVNATNSKP
jgi:hypothetical protein